MCLAHKKLSMKERPLKWNSSNSDGEPKVWTWDPDQHIQNFINNSPQLLEQMVFLWVHIQQKNELPLLPEIRTTQYPKNTRLSSFTKLMLPNIENLSYNLSKGSSFFLSLSFLLQLMSKVWVCIMGFNEFHWQVINIYLKSPKFMGFFICHLTLIFSLRLHKTTRRIRKGGN